MRIDHISIYVSDLEKMKSFYEHYFEGNANDKYLNPSTGLQTYFLSFSDGGRLELMTRSNLNMRSKGLFDCGFIHLAFSVGSKEAVDTLTERLRVDGYRIQSAPRTTGDGYYESCVVDPEGNLIEIVS